MSAPERQPTSKKSSAKAGEQESDELGVKAFEDCANYKPWATFFRAWFCLTGTFFYFILLFIDTA
jgi:hypothetical protein